MSEWSEYELKYCNALEKNLKALMEPEEKCNEKEGRSPVDEFIAMYKRDKEIEEMKLDIIKLVFGDDKEREEAAVRLENRRNSYFGWESNKFILERENI